MTYFPENINAETNRTLDFRAPMLDLEICK